MFCWVCSPALLQGMEAPSPPSSKLLSSQTCFTPLESENWRHGSVKNWTTVPLSPWGTSRMLARQGLPVKSMFCLRRLRKGEYTNATCYRPSAQACAYFIRQLMGFGWGSLSWTDLHFLLQWLSLKAVSHEIFIRLEASFFFVASESNIFQIVSWYHFSIGSIFHGEPGGCVESSWSWLLFNIGQLTVIGDVCYSWRFPSENEYEVKTCYPLSGFALFFLPQVIQFSLSATASASKLVSAGNLFRVHQGSQQLPVLLRLHLGLWTFKCGLQKLLPGFIRTKLKLIVKVNRLADWKCFLLKLGKLDEQDFKSWNPSLMSCNSLSWAEPRVSSPPIPVWVWCLICWPDVLQE